MEVSNETNENSAARITTEQAGKDTAGDKNNSIRQTYSFAADVELKECKYCRVMIPKKAKICPNCKMSLKSHWFLKTVTAILAVVAIGLGSYCLSAYWGLIDGSAIPGWIAKSTVLAPAMSASDASGTSTDMVLVEAGKISGATVAGDVKVSGDDAGSKETGAVEEKKQEASKTSDETEERNQEVSKTSGAVEEKKQEVSKTSDAAEEKKQEVSKSSDEAEEKQQGVSKSSDVAEEKKQEASGTSDIADEKKQEMLEEDGIIEEEKQEESKESAAADTKKLDADAKEAAFREECVYVDYKALLREQETYLDTSVIVEAQIIRQIGGGLFDEHIYYLCMAEEKEGFERYYIIRDDREDSGTLILEGDMITVYGRLFGDCRIPASLIETQPVVPAISMLYCDLTP